MSYNSFFTVKVKYTRQNEDGTFKRVSEVYLIAGMTFTDAEARAYEKLGSMIRGEFSVLAIAKVDFEDIFDNENGSHDKYFVCKISYKTVDADSEKNKNITKNFLIGAKNLEEATEILKESLSTLMVDYKISSVKESNIIEIFPYEEQLDVEISRVPASEYQGEVKHENLEEEE